MVLVHLSLIPTIVILFSLKEIVSESASKNGTNCGLNILCGDCLQQAECVWCIEAILFSDEKQHCLSKNEISLCPKDLQVNPDSTQRIISNKPLQSTTGNHVQLTPQKINITMRLGEEQTVEFTYAQAKDYPIDLYYIMDYSASMERHREKLGKLGNTLAETMKKITSDFRIGFGSFVDKTELPFTSTVPAKLVSPCNLNKGNKKIKCVSPYGFKNHMSLSPNYTKFSIEVSQGKVSGNLDTPEGGFDAIMQAIVCKKEIGWRDKARHLLVFSTDADFHIAGDGKLTGVMLPNDAQCHMSNDEYRDSLTYDYPSVSQLNYVAKKNNINLIFAIVNTTIGRTNRQIGRKNTWGGNLLDSYIELTKNIENSNVGALNQNSENVIDLVLQNYNKIVDTVVIDINSKENIEVKLTSNCTRPIDRGCSDIHLGEKVKFTSVIKPMSCKGYNGKPVTLTLKPEAIDESLTIELNLICGCDCEVPANPYHVQNSSECKYLGDLVCGVCKCLSGTMGEHCDCDERDLYSTKCIQTHGEQVCSGLGDCICGKCECYKRASKNEVISGKYCQCNNYSCNQKNGILCSGKGECSCGKCVCDAGWNGVACDCPEGNSTCIDSQNSLDVCSGRGTCKCGKCECSETHFIGDYCEVSTKDRCEELRSCVDCKVFNRGPLKGEKCDDECSVYTIQEVEEISEDNEDKSTKICKYLDEELCSTRYKYSGDRDKYFIINVQTGKSCPPNALVWILSVIASIVIAGIIMLFIWKVCTSIHDRREYVKFENERKNSKWHGNQNPLYKIPTTTFQNPVYSH